MILVVNCGTSSIKMTLFDKGKKLIDGHLKDIFSPKSPISSYASGVKKILNQFEETGFSLSSIHAIGHRFVHGGDKYKNSVMITESVERDFRALLKMAPLHNPPAFEAIKFCKKYFPNVLQIAVFDTAFHSRMPQKASLYPLPFSISKKYKIKRYGFHGIAHEFSWKAYKKKGGKGKIITVHLGSGCSLAAIKNGLSIDTSMGFTPLDGIMMATRSGELDPAIVAYLSKKLKKTDHEIIELLNNKSGLLGVSETSSNFQELLKTKKKQSKLAIEMFVYQILKKIGSYIAALEGIDAIIFSGGIGENSPWIRKQIAESLSWYLVSVDVQKNKACFDIKPGEIHCISSVKSQLGLYVVGTDENSFIAKEIEKFCSY